MWNILTTEVINLNSSELTVILAGSNEEILEWKINIHTHWTKFTHV